MSRFSKVSVVVEGQVAHLRGTAPTQYLKSAAEELARWTPPIAEVINELAVPPPLRERPDTFNPVRQEHRRLDAARHLMLA